MMIGMASEDGEMVVVYENEGVTEVWTRGEASSVALGILHILSVIQDQEALINALVKAGIKEDQIKSLIRLWHKERELLAKRGDDDE